MKPIHTQTKSNLVTKSTSTETVIKFKTTGTQTYPLVTVDKGTQSDQRCYIKREVAPTSAMSESEDKGDKE